jgi:thiamine biosynthesis protein ThiI
MDLPIVLVRFDEIALKTRHTRSTMRRLLRQNILTALSLNATTPESIEDTWERLIIHTSESGKVAEVSSRVFGVASTSPAAECASDIKSIIEIVSEMAKESLRNGDTFAIRVRRVGKHEFTSKEIAVKCGSSVIGALKDIGMKITVDLDSPDHEFFVEARGERTFVYSTVIRGAGGLPLGSQGRVVSELDDFGSILATWLMMKRGCRPLLVLFDSRGNREGLTSAARSSLLPYAGGMLPIIELSLLEIAGTDELSHVARTCLKYVCMIYIAESQGAEGLVSSERIESSSRTLFKVLGECVGSRLPVFFPLVGLDDEYTLNLARRIGGEPLADKVQIEKRSPATVAEGMEPDLEHSLNLAMEKYREKVREAVAIALAKAMT